MRAQTGVDSALLLSGHLALNDAALDTVLDSLLERRPPPRVMACGYDGLAVPMPAAVPVLSDNVVIGVGSALELCLPADMPGMVEAWKRARRMRGAQLTLRLRIDPERAVGLYFVDARYRYGVYLCFFVGSTGAINDENAKPALFRPRFCTIQCDEVGVIRDIDAAATKILGWSSAELIAKSTLEIMHPEDRVQAIANWMELLAKPASDQRLFVRYRHRDGNYIWFETTHHNRLSDPASQRVAIDLVDVSERMAATEALRENEQLLRRLTEALPVGILQIDAQRRIVHANERLGALLGVRIAATIDEQFALVTTADRNRLNAALGALIARGTPAEIEFTVDHPQGARRCSVAMSALIADKGAVTEAIACVTDITERVRMREEVDRRATYDDLTQCRNRASILKKLESLLHAGSDPSVGIAVLFVDLDRFKAINDRLGHAAGDQLLHRVGERLLHGARTGDIVGRLGGDEFLIICPDVKTPQSALDIARRVGRSVAQQTIISSESIVPNASIGVAWTATAVDADTLVARADAAMYESKRLAAGPVLSPAAPLGSEQALPLLTQTVDSALLLSGDGVVDDARIDAVLDLLLRLKPRSQVIACGENGLTVPMPSAVPVQSGNVVTGVGSGLELCVPADMRIMVEAWKRVRQTRAAQVVVHLRTDPDRVVTMYFLDARHRYGVYLGFFAVSTGTADGKAAAPSLFRPRQCTVKRNEVGVICDIDAATTQILGWSRDELLGTSALNIVHLDDRSQAIANWIEMLGRPDSDQRGLLRFRHRDGTYVWCENTNHNRLGDPAVGCVVTDFVDVSERMEATEALRANEQLLLRLTEALPIGILQIDAKHRIVYANERLGEILAVGSAATIDKQFALVTTADRRALSAALDKLDARGTPAEIEFTVEHPHGDRRCSVNMRPLTGSNGDVTGAIASVTDITERVRMRDELEKRATFDDLTRCRNRRAILKKLESLLHASDRPQPGIAVLYVDLDRFKETNDRLGHATGDELLRRVGERLLNGARAGDVVGRLGGDEFLVICPDVATPQCALDIARGIAVSVAQQTIIGSESIVPNASIGVAWSDVAIDAETLVARADAAMYKAKRRSRGPVLWRAPKLVAKEAIAPD